MPLRLPTTLALAACLAGTAPAQKTAEARPAASGQPDYSREPAVFEHLDRVVTYAADGTGTRKISGVVAIHDPAGVKAYSVINFPYASSAEHVEIAYVRVRRPDGTLLATPATDAQEIPAPVTREAPFYSDLKEEQVPVRSLREGDHLEYEVRIVRTKPEAPNHFWGAENFYTVASGSVVLSETIELHIPKDAYVQTSSSKLKPTRADNATEQVYRWESSQLQPVAGKTHNELLRMEKDPALRDETEPHLPTVAWTNFHTWAEVGAWYRSMEGSRTDPDDDIRAKVKELTAGKSTDEEKTRAIYAYVGIQVHYISVPFGIGPFQPHEASEVLGNQYGDAKDEATLLVSMLSAADILADTVLIGAGVAFNADVPSPSSFNHAINLAHVNGQFVWLDATAEVAPYGLLDPLIRGHKALVIPLDGEAHIEIAPKASPFPSFEKFAATGTLDDKGTSHSHFDLDIQGDAEVFFRRTLRSVVPSQWDEVAQSISSMIHYSGKVTNAEFSSPEDTSLPFHFDYDYERENYLDSDSLRILPQLEPLGLSVIDEKDPPVSPILLGPPYFEISHAAMKLPPGWSAELPASIHAKASFATLDETYTFENGTLITDRRFEVLADNVPAKDWKAYVKWYKDAGLNVSGYVQLKATSYSPTNPQSGREINDPRAAALIKDAAEYGAKNDEPRAKSKLDEAKKINPHQLNLWSAYATLAMVRRDAGELEKDVTNEITEHPSDPSNPTLVRYAAAVELEFHQLDDAVALLQTQVRLVPGDADSVLLLASLLNNRPDLPAAEKVLRTGLLASPTNTAIKMRLGINLVHQHKQDEGEPILRDIISNSEDPGQLNDADYELADANLDLPLAEKAAHHSLALLDTLSNNGETGIPAQHSANLLTDTWDTLGWILYREGKLSEAEPWLRGAWRNSESAENGYHLAVVLQAEKETAAALEQFRLAAAGFAGANVETMHKQIEVKIAELERAGAVAPSFNAMTRLQSARTYEVSDVAVSGKGKRSALVDLDVTTHGTTAIRFISGDPFLQSAFDAVRKIDLHLDIPPDSRASLLRRGILNCHTTSACQLVLVQMRVAQSTE